MVGKPSMILMLVIALMLLTAAAVVAQAAPAGGTATGEAQMDQTVAAAQGTLSCTSIYAVQYTTDPGAEGTFPSPCADSLARVRGVVYWVAEDRYFLAEAAGPWHGIYVYGIRGYTPAVGDEVEVVGTIQEYYGLTEFAFPTTTLVSSGNPLPAPAVVTAADLPFDKGGLSEPYEGVLVEVHDIRATALDGYNVWAFTDGSGGTAKADDWFFDADPAVDDDIAVLRGPVVYDYNEYKIAPRGAGDVQGRLSVTQSSPHGDEGESRKPAEVVPIFQIQGSDFRSPYDGMWVTTAGVVLGLFEGNTPGGSSFDGFYIQDPTGDGNPATSDGILVHHGAHAVTVHVGDVVTVTGWVYEYNEYGEPGPACETQILVESAGDIEWKGTAPLPPAVILDPPGDPVAARAYFEALEGMTVTLPVTGAVVGPTSYGTIMIVPADEGVDRVLRGSPQQGMVFGVRPEERYGGGAPSLMVGSIVAGVNGPLAYTYGNYVVVDQDGYEVEFSQPEPVPAPGWPAAAAHEFTVATLNAYDFFDPVNDPMTGDAVQSLRNYETQKSKLAHTIAQAGCPLLVALQEVENEQVLQELAAVLMAEHGCAYSTHLEEGLDERGIDVAVLAAVDRVIVESVTQYQDCTAYLTGLGRGACPDGLQRLYSRPPLVVTATVQHEALPQMTRRVVLVANHLKSKLSTEGDPESAQWRRLQAESLARLAHSLASGEPEASLMVLGDLNDFEDSLPLDVLYATNLLTNTWYTLAPEERYSYIYNGVSQALDHILISPDLAPLLKGAFPLRVNADWPYLPYANDAALPARASDHDLVAATFLLGLPEIVTLDLVQSEDQNTWISVTGDLDSGYTMTLSCAVPVYVVNSSAVETNNSLLAGYFGFLLDSESVPDGFFDFWAGRGVVEGASGWYATMWQIINGQSPTFYLRVTDGAEGKEFMLVDGFSRDFGHSTDEYWRILGTHPGGAYHYVGVIEDESGLTHTVKLDLTLLTPDLVITKTVETAHTPAYPGDPVTYTVVVTNQGNAAAVGVHVTDSLPPGVTGIDLDWTGTISPGERVEFTILAVVDPSPGLYYGQLITNTASFQYLDCEVGSAEASFAVQAATSLSIVKSVQLPQGQVFAGDTVTYSIVVSNQGAMMALAVTITDTLPPGVEGQDLAWMGDIGPGEQVQLSIPARVSLAPEFRGATLTNTAHYGYDSVRGWDQVAFAVSRAWRTYLPVIVRFE